MQQSENKEVFQLKKQVWLQNLTWEEVKVKTRESRETIILPIGSTEQNGYHLPVGTDTMVANTIAEAAAVKANILVAPPLWFGWSHHHLVLPGTITIRAEVLIEVVYDIVGFNLFVIQALTGEPIVQIAKYAFPFFLLMLIITAILTIFPEIALVLPKLMVGK
ncbi:MAG: creatininase family protein [Deltaproteobacteria bacterium]|nr:creatininase family protein [Deltaproteobacteria bacterium]